MNDLLFVRHNVHCWWNINGLHPWVHPFRICFLWVVFTQVSILLRVFQSSLLEIRLCCIPQALGTSRHWPTSLCSSPVVGNVYLPPQLLSEKEQSCILCKVYFKLGDHLLDHVTWDPLRVKRLWFIMTLGRLVCAGTVPGRLGCIVILPTSHPFP